VTEGTAPDKEASYTRTATGSHYGYQAHISTDGEYQSIRQALISPGGTQEAHVFERVSPADAKAIYADKAYDTKANRAWLHRQQIVNGILKKGAHHIKLSEKDNRMNHQKGLVRKNIERVFGHLKQGQGYRRARSLGWAKNQLELTLKALTYNLKRWARIMELHQT
jgi:IS5 family transposase